MDLRLHTFHAQESFTSDTTKVIDINISDVISLIVIELGVANSSSTVTAHPLACLTNIEIVDGSDVIYELDAFQADAVDWYHTGGRFRSNWNMTLTGNTMQRFIGLNFGRFLFDPVYAFDPTKFVNPQLRLTLDIDAGGGSAATNYLTCFAALFRDRPSELAGFLSHKEIKAWTAASATHEYIDLPTDLPYRNIYLRASLAGTEPNQALTNIKISENQDRYIPYDMGLNDALRVLEAKYPPVEEGYYGSIGTSQTTFYVAPTTRVVTVGNRWATAGAARDLNFYDGDGSRLYAITVTGATNAHFLTRGYLPHCVFEIPCGIQDVPGKYYDPRGLVSLRADITGNSTPACTLFVQQVRPY